VGSWEAFDDAQLWPAEPANAEAKHRVALQMTERLRPGDVVGVGSGSTSLLTLHALAARATTEGIDWLAVPTSYESELTCSVLGVRTTSLQVARPDWSFDGADEVDPDSNLNKGRGGALLREKIVMASSPERYVVVDESKLVERLGTNFAVPIEVLPEAVRLVRHALANLGVRDLSVRPGGTKDGPLITEHGNLILDAWLPAVDDATERHLQAIPGVVECGLFIGYAPTVLVAR
jgi:ribose 5-phosphate isomerase A